MGHGSSSIHTEHALLPDSVSHSVLHCPSVECKHIDEWLTRSYDMIVYIWHLQGTLHYPVSTGTAVSNSFSIIKLFEILLLTAGHTSQEMGECSASLVNVHHQVWLSSPHCWKHSKQPCKGPPPPLKVFLLHISHLTLFMPWTWGAVSGPAWCLLPCSHYPWKHE